MKLLCSLEEDFIDGFFGTHFALKNILQLHSGLTQNTAGDLVIKRDEKKWKPQIFPNQEVKLSQLKIVYFVTGDSWDLKKNNEMLAQKHCNFKVFLFHELMPHVNLKYPFL